MIFAQYKNAITFAVIILGLAVLVADPGTDSAADGQETVAAPPSEPDANLAPPTAAQQVAPAEADPEWYGASGSEATQGNTPDEDGGYNVGSAGRSTPAPTQGRPVASAPAPAPTYVPPPPPPQVPPGG